MLPGREGRVERDQISLLVFAFQKAPLPRIAPLINPGAARSNANKRAAWRRVGTLYRLL
jgi:hypothetical protein